MPAPLHGTPSLLSAKAFSLADKLALGRAFRAMMRPGAIDHSNETLGDWLRRHKQTEGAMNRFWRLVIASALNADIENIAVPYAAKVIRELFMNSAEAGSMGMSTVPLSELYAGAERFLNERGSGVLYNTQRRSDCEWEDGSKQWSIETRNGTLTSDYVVLALPFEAAGKLLANNACRRGRERVDGARSRSMSIGHSAACTCGSIARSPICRMPCFSIARFTGSTTRAVLQPWRKSEGQLCRTGRQRVADVCGAVARRGHCAVGEGTGGILSGGEGSEAGKGGADQGSARHVWRAAGDRCGAAGFVCRRGRRCFWPATGSRPGWPSTMESAARSGHLAAEALSAAAGRAQKFLVAGSEAEGVDAVRLRNRSSEFAEATADP